MNIEQIKAEAEKELEAERFREAVDKYKEKIKKREGESVWSKLFPYRIIIIKKEVAND